MFVCVLYPLCQHVCFLRVIWAASLGPMRADGRRACLTNQNFPELNNTAKIWQKQVHLHTPLVFLPVFFTIPILSKHVILTQAEPYAEFWGEPESRAHTHKREKNTTTQVCTQALHRKQNSIQIKITSRALFHYFVFSFVSAPSNQTTTSPKPLGTGCSTAWLKR